MQKAAKYCACTCRTLSREIIFTIIPAVIMVFTILEMTSWQVQRQIVTKRLVVRHGVPPVADTVKDFFDQKALEAEHLRYLVASGAWRDPTDIHQLASLVVPTLLKEQKRNYSVANQQYAFISDTGVISIFNATNETAGIDVAHTIYFNSTGATVRTAWLNASDKVLCTDVMNKSSSDLSSWHHSRIQQELSPNETAWVRPTERLFGEEVTALRFALNWSIGGRTSEGTAPIRTSLFYFIYLQKVLNDALLSLQDVDALIVSTKTEYILAFNHLQDGKYFLSDYPQFSFVRDAQGERIVSNSTAAVFSPVPGMVLGSDAETTDWRLLVVAPELLINGSLVAGIQQQIQDFFVRQYDLVRVARQAITSRRVTSPFSSEQLEQLLLPLLRVNPEVFGVMHVELPRVEESPIQLLLRGVESGIPLIRSHSFTFPGAFSFRRVMRFDDTSTSGNFEPTFEAPPVVGRTAKDSFLSAIGNYPWIAATKNMSSSPFNIYFGNGAIHIAFAMEWPYISCLRGASSKAYMQLSYSVEEISLVLRALLVDTPGSVAVVVNEDGRVLGASNLSNVGLHYSEIDVLGSVGELEFSEMKRRLGTVCNESTVNLICRNSEVIGVTQEHGGNQIDLAKMASTDIDITYGVQKQRMSMYLMAHFDAKGLSKAIQTEHKVGFGVILLVIFLFFVTTVAYSLYHIQSILYLRKFLHAVAVGNHGSIATETIHLSSNTEIREMQHHVLKIRQAMVDYSAFVAGPVLQTALEADSTPARGVSSSLLEGARREEPGSEPSIEMTAVSPDLAAAVDLATGSEERLSTPPNELVRSMACYLRLTILHGTKLLEKCGPSDYSALHTKVAAIFTRQVSVVAGTVVDLGINSMGAIWCSKTASRSGLLRMSTCISAVTIANAFERECKEWFSKSKFPPFQILLTLASGEAWMASLGSSDVMSFIVGGPVVQQIEPRLRKIAAGILGKYNSVALLETSDGERAQVHSTPALVVSDDATTQGTETRLVSVPLFYPHSKSSPLCLLGLARTSEQYATNALNYTAALKALAESRPEDARSLARNIRDHFPAVVQQRLLEVIERREPSLLTLQEGALSE